MLLIIYNIHDIFLININKFKDNVIRRLLNLK